MQLINKGGVCTALGFSAAAAVADMKGNKKGKLDAALLVSDAPCVAAALFTTNLVKAAPVLFDQQLLAQKGDVMAVLVNSGNANACTGERGLKACADTAHAVADALEFPADCVLTASTGVIGTDFPTAKLLAAMPALVGGLDDDGGKDFATAILTTDTVAKECAVLVETSSGSFVVGGACKGAGMIDPAMATMLAFVTTDAECTQDFLQACLRDAAGDSFNCVTVDGDMSTNDSLILLANGMSGVKIKSDADKKAFQEALSFVCRELAMMIAKDGEGAEKFITIKVRGAADKEQARKCATKIANSPLVKTMFTGEDPNWGRLLASAGASGAVFDPQKVSIYFDDLHYVEHGQLIDVDLEKKAAKVMKKKEYTITIDLGAGEGRIEYYTCDLTKEYIAINADYRS